MKLDPQFYGIELPSGTTLLRGQYVIERPLSQGGFGVTYLARDSLKRQVVIKECFPQDLCVRAGLRVCAKSDKLIKRFETVLKQFQREALRLAALDHIGIVRVHQVFSENNTSFLAMDFVNGHDLCTCVEDIPDRIDAALLPHIMKQTLEAVQYTHAQGILHRDLAPDNMILDAQNKITLIDFGSARDIDLSQDGREAKLLAVKDGYSPHEFYVEGAPHSVVSDIYALGATFHYLITGMTPPDSEDRLNALKSNEHDPYVPLSEEDWGVDAFILKTINQALSIGQKDRIASTADWLKLLTQPKVEKGMATRPLAKVESPALNVAVAHVGPARQPQVQPRVVTAKVAAQPRKTADTRQVPTPVATEETPQPAVGTTPVPRPSAEPLVDISEIRATISQLVSATNSDITPGLPQNLKTEDGKMVRTKRTVHVLPEATPKGPPVDIFGNPIEDIEAYLNEQDGTSKGWGKIGKSKKSKASSAGSTNETEASMQSEEGSLGDNVPDDTQDVQPTQPKGTMSRLFKKIIPGKGSGSSAVLQN